MTTDPWDLLVVGGGTAGLVAAKTAARLGARVLLVERDRTGGDCLWTGCVPSKSFLAAASAAATARGGAALGVDVDGVRVDWPRVRAHVQAVIAAVEPADSVASLEEVGVVVRSGTARLTGPTTAALSPSAGGPDEVVAFRQAVLATGAGPAVPPVPGLADVDVLTSETVWELDALPGRLAVLGGGSIGCELGQGFARLGAATTVVEGADRLLPREDPAAGAAVERALVADGARVVTGRSVARVVADPGDPRVGTLHLDDGDVVAFDRLLVAVGRTPRTSDLGLEAAGVEVDDRGFVVVDAQLRTTNLRIRAAGDLTGHPQLTHVAGVHGSLAASNAVLGLRRAVDPVVPRVTYTQPEVAAVGVPTGSPPAGVRVLEHHHRDVDRARAEGRTDGTTRLAVDGRGRLVGATVVGPRAGETLGELVLAVRQGLRTRDLAATTHAYPTWNDGPWSAAVADVRAQLTAPRTRRATTALVRARRGWLRLRDRSGGGRRGA